MKSRFRKDEPRCPEFQKQLARGDLTAHDLHSTGKTRSRWDQYGKGLAYQFECSCGYKGWSMYRVN